MDRIRCNANDVLKSGCCDLSNRMSYQDLEPLEDNLCNGYRVQLYDGLLLLEAVLEYINGRWVAWVDWNASVLRRLT